MPSVKAWDENWGDIARALLVENKAQFHSADMSYMGWLSPRMAKTKQKNFLVVAFTKPEDVNLAIRYGMTWEGSHRPPELYAANCKLVQCQNFQEYGHVRTRCHPPQRCAKGARPHPANTCPAKFELGGGKDQIFASG